MTTLSKDEIIALAKEAEGVIYTNRFYKESPAAAFSERTLERFAHLCRADLVAEIFMSDALRDRLSELLTGTANALKGDPGEDCLHDWSDLPKVAGQLVAEKELIQSLLNAKLTNSACASIEAERDELKADAERWRTVLQLSSAQTLQLHNIRPDLRTVLIDAAVDMKRGEA